MWVSGPTSGIAPLAMLSVTLAAWLYYHFVVKGLGLDLNSLNTILLLAALLVHRNVRNFTRALQTAILSCWPIVVMYHLYGGVAGLIQFTTVGASFAGAFAAISTRYTFPFLTALASTIVASFVPSSASRLQRSVRRAVTSSDERATTS